MSRLDSLTTGFRSTYVDHATIERQLAAWHEAFPDLTRLTKIGTTPQGRALTVLTIGTDPDRPRPTAWVDGNMHAIELAGSSVALAIAEDFLAAHVEPDRLAWSAELIEAARAVRLFVLPRMSPDGAECVLTTGRYVRSLPRDDRAVRGASRWLTGDVDGDGRSLAMRVLDPAGDYVAASPEHPDLMVAREIGDVGPFYRLLPEGTIEHWDGFNVPTPEFNGDNPVDLNRNFPWSWSPAHEQVGAGRFPTSEVESRAVVEFTCAHPEIFAWLNLHCFGGVFIRPLGHGPDGKLDQTDLGHFRLLEQWAKETTSYPTVSGYDEFLYAPDKPLHGDLTDYAYHQRGAFAYVVELWDLFARLGLPRPKKFVDYYGHLSRADLIKFAAWDREHNAGRTIQPWRAFEHPQLGKVEVGGIDSRVGYWNPPLELIGELCAQQSACFVRVAAMAPALVVRSATATAVGDGLWRVDVVVDNRGYLPTHGLPSARALEWNEPLYADATPGDGCALVEPTRLRVALGHLAGWGRGVGLGANDLAYSYTPGSTACARASWLVRGRGQVTVRVGAPRVGFLDALVSLA